MLINHTGIILAQDEDNKEMSVDLEPITITAAKIARGLSEVPSSVSVIEEKDIKDSNAKSVPDLLKNLEGIYTYDSSGVGTVGRVNMRGFWGGMSTHQLILIDGIPQNRGEDKLVDWDLIPLDNIERIEIVRGPASALYGDNAMSGVINIITKKPSDKMKNAASFSYGSYDSQNYNVSTSGASERVDYYIGATRKLTDGFRKFCDYENFHLSGKLDFLIDEAQDLKLSLAYRQKEQGAYPWALTEAQLEDNRRQPRPGSASDKTDAEKFDLGVTYSNDIGTTSNIEGTFYYRYEDGESFYTSGSTPSSTREQLEEENTCGLISRLNINPVIFGKKHSFTTGFDLERNDFDYEEHNAPNQLRTTIRKDYSVERYKIGFFLQDEIKLFDPLKLVGGTRGDLIGFDFTDDINGSNSKETHMFKISPNVGVVYTYKENSNIYASYSQAFRSPTIGQMFTYGSISNPDLDPEEASNYEIGFHHRLGEGLKAGASLYWMELDNEIWYDYSESKYKNYGETSHGGLETRLDFKIIKGLYGFFNYAYTRAKNESGSNENKYLSNIPKHKGSLGIKFETEFGLKANLFVTKTGSCYIDAANNDKLPSYITLDSKISYGPKWYSVFLAVDNILDKEYSSYGFKSGTVRSFSPAPRRTFTFGMEAEF